MKMRAVVVESVGAFRFAEVDIPQPRASEVLVQVEVTGLCRTDLKLIRVGHRDLTLPRIPGEEVVGRVVECGSDVDCHLKDKLVYLYPGISCGRCVACQRGAENLCSEMRIMGFHRDGGFAQYVATPAASILPVPTGLRAEEAVFAEPLSCCLNALELSGVAPGFRVLIWGAGPAGTLLRRAAMALGAEATCVEPDARRRQLVDGVAEPPPWKADVAIVAVGNVTAYQAALSSLAPRGRLVVFSGLSPRDAEFLVDANQLHYLEQSIVGAYGCAKRHGQWALELISSGKVSVADMISHHLPLSSLDRALDHVANRTGMKILLRP